MSKDLLISNRQPSAPAHEIQVGGSGDGGQLGTRIVWWPTDLIPSGWAGDGGDGGFSGPTFKSVLLCDRPEPRGLPCAAISPSVVVLLKGFGLGRHKSAMDMLLYQW